MQRWRLVFSGDTPVYATRGATKPVGTVHSMTATASRSRYAGAWWYRIESARAFKGRWARANGRFTAARL